jgi:hypothetical protein
VLTVVFNWITSWLLGEDNQKGSEPNWPNKSRAKATTPSSPNSSNGNSWTVYRRLRRPVLFLPKAHPNSMGYPTNTSSSKVSRKRVSPPISSATKTRNVPGNAKLIPADGEATKYGQEGNLRATNGRHENADA